MNNGADVDDDSDEEIPELSPDADTDEEEACAARPHPAGGSDGWISCLFWHHSASTLIYRN